MDLEARLHALQTELDSAPASMRQKNLDPSLWIPRNPPRHTLSGHRMQITGLAFHPTFTVVASCSEDTTIKIWDWETGEFEQTIKGHTKSVHDVDFSFDGKLLSNDPPMLETLLSSILLLRSYSESVGFDQCIRHPQNTSRPRPHHFGCAIYTAKRGSGCELFKGSDSES